MKIILNSSICSLVAIFAVQAESVNSATATARNVAKEQSKFIRKLNKLSSADRLKVLQKLNSQSTSFVDSDADGTPDIYEHFLNTNICDPDSNDDGTSDGAEREIKGAVSELALPTFRIGAITFTLTSTTTFDDVTAETLQIGSCIEAKGLAQTDGSILATSVSLDDDCRKNGSGGDDRGGHSRGRK